MGGKTRLSLEGLEAWGSSKENALMRLKSEARPVRRRLNLNVLKRIPVHQQRKARYIKSKQMPQGRHIQMVDA